MELREEKEAEEDRHLLLELQAVASAVESSGQARLRLRPRQSDCSLRGRVPLNVSTMSPMSAIRCV